MQTGGGLVVDHQGNPARPRLSLRTRLLVRLVRALDRGEDVSADEIHRLLSQLPGRVGHFGPAAPGLLEELRRLGHNCVTLEPHEGALSGGAPEVFDVIVMIQSLADCLDPLEALEDVFRLLRPGGWFICEVPDEFFTRPGLGEALGQTGFRLERVRRLARQPSPGELERHRDAIRMHARKPLDAGFGTI
jgi:SAM-dependent methyltransferase